MTIRRGLAMSIIAATALVLVAVLSPVAHAGPTEGATCSTLWKTIKAGKARLQCADTPLGNAWIRVFPTPKTQADALVQMSIWAASLGVEGQAEMEAAVGGSATLQDQLTIAQQQRDANAQLLGEQTARMNALNQEIAGLPNAIANALSISKSAEAALEAPKQAYLSAQSRVSSLLPAYQSALNSQYASAATGILCMFGYTTCSSRPFSTSSYNSSAISQYNAASSQLAGAKAAYDAAYADYKSKYDTYKGLFDRQSSAQNELADANAKIASAQGASEGLESSLAIAHLRVDTMPLLTSQLGSFTSSSAALAAALTPEAINAAPNWKAYFAQQGVAMGRHVVLRKWLSATWQKYATGA